VLQPTAAGALAARLDLAADGLAVLPGALDAEQLAGLNAMVDTQLARLQRAVAGLGEAELRRQGQGFCFGDIAQRDRGKYELRVPGIDLRPPAKGRRTAAVAAAAAAEAEAVGTGDQVEPINQVEPAGPPAGFPDFLLPPSARWWPMVAGALGPDAELRSATVILSMAAALGTAEPAASQHWHSDGSLPPDDFALPAYALVVYIPLRSVPPGGGRVEYLPATHTNRSLRVERNGEPWSATWGADLVTPEMGAGDAVVYSYTTQHRGLRSEAPGHRPVLKLDYFMPGVGTRKAKDGWCEQNGFLLAARRGRDKAKAGRAKRRPDLGCAVRVLEGSIIPVLPRR
jgi:hypothetical protein